MMIRLNLMLFNFVYMYINHEELYFEFIKTEENNACLQKKNQSCHLSLAPKQNCNVVYVHTLT